MQFQNMLRIIIVCLLLLQVFHLAHTACQPPDKPEGGSYRPENRKYLPGDKVIYTCKEKLTRIGKEIRYCLRTGKWSEMTPFCDSPAKLKNPSSSSDSFTEVRNVVDRNPSTCFQSRNGTGQNIKVYLDTPAAVNVIRLYLQKGTANFRISTVQRRRKEITPCVTFERELEESEWVTLVCQDSDYPADHVIIQDLSAKPNILAVCEIEAYVKDDVWCKHPPNYFIPNGHLEVSHDKATLHCAEGYKVMDDTRLVCEKNTWAGPNLQCEEILCDQSVGNNSVSNGEWVVVDNKARKLSVGIQRQLKCNHGFRVVGKPDKVTCTKFGSWSKSTATCIGNEPPKKEPFKIIAISVGAVVALLILFLLGLTVFLIQRKRSREVVVIYKPDEDGYASPSICKSGTTASSEAEYSTVYYDAVHKPSFPPTPTRPPHLRPEAGYTKPIDSCDSPATFNKKPADIAFGTLKSSALYDPMG